MTMFPQDDPRFHFEDDPRPPEPDTAVLQRVVARGRQRLFRRRALFGGAVVAIAAVLVSGGVAAAQHHSAGPNVSVTGPGVVVDDTTTTVTTTTLLPSTPTTTGSASSPLTSLPVTTPQGPSCPACAPQFPVPAGTQAAKAADFIGEVKVSATQVTAGDGVGVELDVTNFTDHPVDVEGALGGPAAAVVCTNDLTADGHTNTPLHNDNPDANIFWIVAPVLASGEQTGIGPMTIETTDAEVGVVTCEAVLVGALHNGNTITSYIIARLDNIPAVTYTVLPAGATTTTTIPTDTSTTTPETTVPPQ